MATWAKWLESNNQNSCRCPSSAPYSSHITTPPFGSIFLEGQLHSVTKSMRKRSLRQLDGGARHPLDLRARRSFEHHGFCQWAPPVGEAPLNQARYFRCIREPTRVLGTLRDMHGSVHQPGVMSCIGKMLDTPFPPLPKEISNYVEDANYIDSQPESSFPWPTVL